MINNKYQKSKIYGIKCAITGDLYVGSTYEQLSVRMSKHYTDYTGWANVLFGDSTRVYRNFRASFKIFFNDDWDYYLIKDFPCNSNLELETEEFRIMDELEKEFPELVIVNIQRKKKKINI